MRARFIQSFVNMVSVTSYREFCQAVAAESKQLFLSTSAKIVFVRKNRLLCYNADKK